MRRHGTTAAAALAAITLVAAPGMATAAKQPALTTGTAERGEATWRLEGRQLELRLTAPLAGTRSGPVQAAVVCGDAPQTASTWEAGPVGHEQRFASAPLQRRVTVRRGTRLLRVTFARDAAVAVNHCSLLRRGRHAAQTRSLVAQMQLRRGTATCAPAAREEVVLGSRSLIVTQMRWSSTDDGFVNYRACARPHGRLVPLTSSRTHRYGSSAVGGFVAAGTRVAWSAWGGSSLTAERSAEVAVRDVGPNATGPLARGVRFPYEARDAAVGFDVPQLAIAPDGGAVAWALRTTRREPGEQARSETRVEAARLVGAPATLAQTAGVVTRLGIATDGSVFWHDGDVPSSAPLP